MIHNPRKIWIYVEVTDLKIREREIYLYETKQMQ